MSFVIGYILFIALDILASGKFLSLGMTPVAFFVSGTGLALSAYVFGLHFTRLRATPWAGVVRFFLVLVIFSSLDKLYLGLTNIFTILQPDMEVYFHVERVIQGVQAGLLLLFLFLALRRRLQTTPWGRWLLYSAVTGFFYFLYLFTAPAMPALVYRYLGVADLAVVFGWLMFVVELMKEEVGALELV